MKSLNGSEIASYMKVNQAKKARDLILKGVKPKLVIVRDNDAPVISKYVQLKQRYGADIGVDVEDWLDPDLSSAIKKAGQDKLTHGIIVQLPLVHPEKTASIVAQLDPEKDVDGLNPEGDVFESATATAINLLLAGYDIELRGQSIAIVGHGRLVGAPLEKMWQKSGYDVTVFRKGDDLSDLDRFEIIITATGVPHLITSEMVQPGAVVVDAGTASEGGVLVGDVDDSVRERKDLRALTPKLGGVGPLTVTALFEHVLRVAEKN